MYLAMKRDFYTKVLNSIGFFLVPIVLFYLMEAYEHNAFVEVRPLAQMYNIFLFELIAWCLFFLIGNGTWALRMEILITLLYGIVNHYVMAFRSTPFVPWDVFSIKTAASVAGNYDFTPTKAVVVVTICLIALFVLVRFVDLHAPKKVLWRILPMGCVGLVLIGFVNLLQDKTFQTRSYLYPHLFTPAHMTKVNGMAVTFAMDLAFVYVEKPEGYSEERAKEILSQYETQVDTLNCIELGMLSAVQTTQTVDFPNVIVVMNEAFSDLSVLGDFMVNEDYMPFVHRLQKGAKNTITGNLEVSVCGGNTANTEFEFLTGHTMDYFPVGSIPYQQYITGKLPSLASQLKELGYATYGMHPYNASGWKRDEVYPLLGLETNYFVSDFENREYIRSYVSDASAYEKIIETYENKEAGKPIFIFEVTMQNHGGYTEQYENFTADVVAEEFHNEAINQYLSLIKVSDKELEKLVDYFNEVEEDTVILFFGDHQPSDSIANPILRLNGINTKDMTVEEAKLRYQVPYVVWANFDIPEGNNVDTDISFLSAHLLEAVDLPISPYQRFLLELETVLAKGTTSIAEKEKVEEFREKYEILQYYFMFDYQEE